MKTKSILFISAVMLLASCSHKATNVAPTATPPAVAVGVSPSQAIPMTTVFKMTGDYADNVAVTLDDKGNLLYYPAPSDITPASKPVSLGNGWWLNRQGINPGSVFTSYTFDQYSKLSKTPSQKEIKSKIIPGSGVKVFRTVNVPASEAMSRLDEIKAAVAH